MDRMLLNVVMRFFVNGQQQWIRSLHKFKHLNHMSLFYFLLFLRKPMKSDNTCFMRLKRHKIILNDMTGKIQDTMCAQEEDCIFNTKYSSQMTKRKH